MEKLWREEIVGRGRNIESRGSDRVGFLGTVRGKVDGTETGAEDSDRGATDATDMLVCRRGERGKERGVIDDHAIGACVKDEGATVGVASKAVWESGKEVFRDSLSLGRMSGDGKVSLIFREVAAVRLGRWDRGLEGGLDLSELTMGVVRGARDQGVRASRDGVSVVGIKQCRGKEEKEVEIIERGPEGP